MSKSFHSNWKVSHGDETRYLTVITRAVLCLVAQSCPTLMPARLLCPGDSLGKNTGVGCHALLQGIFPTQGLNPDLLHCRQFLYPIMTNNITLIILIILGYYINIISYSSRLDMKQKRRLNLSLSSYFHILKNIWSMGVMMVRIKRGQGGEERFLLSHQNYSSFMCFVIFSIQYFI